MTFNELVAWVDNVAPTLRADIREAPLVFAGVPDPLAVNGATFDGESLRLY